LPRVVRVLPDVTAVDRAFDYTIPEGFGHADVPVGTIVRVPLHGRRVRGWIVDKDVDPEGRDLLEVLAVVSAGPPADVIELSPWIARRWAGPRSAVLRSAGAPNVVLPVGQTPVCAGSAPIGPDPAQTVIRWPPLPDRRARVHALCPEAGSTIVCVADAGRSRALASYLQRQGRTVALLHSFLSDAERTDAWRRASKGECVVVGGRIAALAPVPDLAAAVVIDDADEALQEERAPTWHARDVLCERAARAGAPFTIVSPAPTVEALFDRKLDEPAPDVERSGWPRVEVVDRRNDPPGAGLLTSALADALHATDGLTVCVLNRRGRFRLLVCGNCGHLLRWDRTEERAKVCPECGATKLRVLRAGVTRVGEELAALVPGARVVDVDADTADVPDADIVIGTEAVLHRAAVRRRRPALVAYLDLDQELLAPRYRAAAQAHWLVTRGAQLLSARPRTETRLLLQTRIPDHVVVEALVHADPTRVIESELEYRKALGYPPFGALAELSGQPEPLTATIDALRALDIQSTGVQVFGPHDDAALVIAPEWDALADALAAALPAGRAFGRVRASVDPPRV
jgi:primosomal protein N' (replication factor Y) (superfamily II helicase)